MSNEEHEGRKKTSRAMPQQKRQSFNEIIKHKEKICFISFEEKKEKTFLRSFKLILFMNFIICGSSARS
jgi:hypothetical protein